MLPEFAFAEATDLDRLAQLVDDSGIYTFSGHLQNEQQWPTEAEAPTQVKFRTVKAANRNPSIYSWCALNIRTRLQLISILEGGTTAHRRSCKSRYFASGIKSTVPIQPVSPVTFLNASL